MINQLTIIGVGYIGRSIASAIRSASFTKQIVGFDPAANTSDYLCKKNIFDRVHHDLVSAIKNADLIVITSSFDQYPEIFEAIAGYSKETAVVTEIASMKSPVLALAKEKLSNRIGNMVPCHPVINFQHNKQESTMPDLFAERAIILTPLDETKQRSISLVKNFWQKVGGEVEIKTAAENDALLATISHLPRILAFTFINGLEGEAATLRYITEHFSEFTNMASQCPIIWSDVCVTNRQTIIKELDRFESNLKKLRLLLESEDIEKLLKQF